MMVFVLGADHGRDERFTVHSMTSAVPAARLTLVPPGQHHVLNEAVFHTEDPYCMTIRAGGRVDPDFKLRLEEWIHPLMQAPFSWIHLLPDTETASFQSRFRPGEAGPVIWNLQIMKSLGLKFPGNEVLPCEIMMEWYQMQEMHGTHPGCSQESSDWSPSRYKFRDWQRKGQEWKKLAPILLSPKTSLGMSAEVQKPRLSIVLTVYNEPDYMQWAVRSVLAQTSGSWELMMIDDGSTDHTGCLMQKLASEYPFHIRCVKHPCNLGKAAALNTALEHVRAPWLLELDADDWLDPHAVQSITEMMSTLQPEAAFLYGNHSEWREENDRNLSYRGASGYSTQLDIKDMLISGAPLAPRVFRTETLRALGGWKTDDPARGRLYEDMLMIIRILQNNQARFLQGIGYNRRIRSNSITRTHQEQYNHWREWVMGMYSL
ncbi:glycosyltransferase [Paenibacillus sp. HJL G12]|uniref:Glycosyltransferase n=1 Tax=Paenibacillus dendrobii TaxID=2691084 RepID=A0A7X3LHG3_9BACL|nr:glycosyltransferase [Paenibacillus dendrobii]